MMATCTEIRLFERMGLFERGNRETSLGKLLNLRKISKLKLEELRSDDLPGNTDIGDGRHVAQCERLCRPT